MNKLELKNNVKEILEGAKVKGQQVKEFTVNHKREVAMTAGIIVGAAAGAMLGIVARKRLRK